MRLLQGAVLLLSAAKPFVRGAPADFNDNAGAAEHGSDQNAVSTELLVRQIMPIVSPTSSVVGLAMTPLFLASAVIGIKNGMAQLEAARTHTTVRIWAGYSGRKNGPDAYMDTGGDVPGVCLWNNVGVPIACANDKSHINEQNYYDIRVFHDKGDAGNTRPAYISFFMKGDNAVCLSGFTLTAPDGATYNWLGDMAAICENQNVFSYASKTAVTANDYHPFCVWMDKNHDEVFFDGSNQRIPHQGFSIHLEDLRPTQERADSYSPEIKGGNATYATFPDESDLPQDDGKEHHMTYCGIPARFSAHTSIGRHSQIQIFDPPLEYQKDTGLEVVPNAAKDSKTILSLTAEDVPAWDPKCLLFWWRKDCLNPKGGKMRRAVEGEQSASTVQHLPTTRVVVDRKSSADLQKARVLCNMQTSFGPSFASVEEGQFCDMSEKKLYPFCDGEDDQRACFDLESKSLHGETDQVAAPQFGPYKMLNGTTIHANVLVSTSKMNGTDNHESTDTDNTTDADNTIDADTTTDAETTTDADKTAFSKGPVLRLWADVEEWN